MKASASAPLAALAGVLGASLALSCSPKGTPSDPPVRESASAGPTSAAAGLGLDSGKLFALGGALATLGEPGLYDAAQQSADFDANAPHVLTMYLGGAVLELEATSMWGTSEGTPLRKIQDRLVELAKRPQLKGLVLRFDELGMSMAAAQELRESLISFKGQGARKLHCHTEGVSNVTYMVMTACDQIAVAPTGEIAVTGVAAMPVHLKGLLDRFGIQANFLHVGDYKGAAEPLTLDKPSAAMQETIGAILDQNYQLLVDNIAAGRGLEPDAVKALIDTALFTSPDAVKAKLADVEMTYDAYRTTATDGKPWAYAGLEDKNDSTPDFNEVMKNLGLQKRTRSSEDHVAVVYAVGNIIDGVGEGLVGARGEIASHTLIPALRSLAQADSVKAVVLRVDSGGGSALASEQIWHEIQSLTAMKPVVVSMGGMAASGGYYISCGANRIFADAGTLTGSIGVVGGKLVFGKALENFGIKSFPEGRGKRALMWSSLHAWNADEQAAIQDMMEDIYKVFVDRVATGRGKSYDEVHAIAQGRVWTGEAALENGLVDELGGLDDAIAYATKLAKLDAPGELEIYPPTPTLMDFVASYTAGGMSAKVGAEHLSAQLELMLGTETAQVLLGFVEQVQSFRRSAVQTTTLLPVVWQFADR